MVLGATGLLRGKKATTHWAWTDLLVPLGAIPTKGRVVRDGKFMTGGGVTAGIDFALTMVSEIAGQDVAESIQLSIEYAPARSTPAAPTPHEPNWSRLSEPGWPGRACSGKRESRKLELLWPSQSIFRLTGIASGLAILDNGPACCLDRGSSLTYVRRHA